MRWRSIISSIVTLLIVLGATVPAQADVAKWAVPQNQWDAVLSEQHEALELQVADGLSTYVIDADFQPATESDLGLITGQLDLDWINPAAEPAESILFRLYVNAPRYRDGEMTVSDVHIAGTPVDADLSLDDTLLDVTLPEPVDPGERVAVSLSWQAIIPDDTLSGFGMFNHDTRSDTYTLDHWIPLLSAYDPVHGFDRVPISENGDPVFTNVALFDVTFGDLTGFEMASTGVVESERDDDDGLYRRLVSGPVRNFTLAISPNYQVVTGTVGGTEIRSYYLPGHEVRGEASVKWSITAIELFNELIGPYPYQQFSIVDAVIGPGAAGIEFPQIVYMASDYYDEPLDDERFPRGQEFTLVHEILHQWFYGLVGNNQHQHAFLDESLTNYLTTVYFERVYGEDVALQQALLNIIAPYVIYLWGMSRGPSTDEPVNTPTDAFSSGTAYGVIIYNKGPLAMQAIREAMGDDPFFAAIAAYFLNQQLLIAQPDDLYAAFEAEAPEELDFDELWSHWIEEANGAEDFPAELLNDILAALRGG